MADDLRQDICDDCQSLDLARLLRKASHFFQTATALDGGSWGRDDALPICRFPDRLSVESRCPLCSFFRSMRIAPHHRNHKLLALRSHYIYFFLGGDITRHHKRERLTHDFFLAVVPDLDSHRLNEYESRWHTLDAREKGTIHCINTSGESTETSNAIFYPRVVGETLDFSLVLRWLSFCREHHGSRCVSSKNEARTLHSLRVINCKETPPRLETRPFTEKYVTLSYVWGPGPPEAWPKVVLDAVAVTLSLGLQYLWVDRLCIDQYNRTEKDYLISHMDLIYQCSELTIIAAAGPDASHGLPGSASSTKRTAETQPHISVSQDLHLVSSLTDPRLIIEQSVWSSRGWTYQEGVLATRRLVFTDQQVYFECRGMAIQESLDLPLSLFHEESGKKMENFMRSGIFRGSSDPFYSTRSSVWGFADDGDESLEFYDRLLRLDDHIHTFTRRSLSDDGDSLRAFTGISKRYGSGNGLGILVGLPVWSNGFSKWGSSILHSFALSLFFWGHTSGRPGAEEDRDVGVGAVRRKHLPSWTWAGWKGPITWCPFGRVHAPFADAASAGEWSHKGVTALYTPEMVLSDSSGGFSVRLSELDTVDKLPADGHYLLSLPNAFVLDYRRLKLRGSSIDVLGGSGASLSGEVTLSPRLSAAEVVAGMEREEFAAVLVHVANSSRNQAMFIIIRRDHGRDVWERVGSMDLIPDDRDMIWDWSSTGELLDILALKAFADIIVIS